MFFRDKKNLAWTRQVQPMYKSDGVNGIGWWLMMEGGNGLWSTVKSNDE